MPLVRDSETGVVEYQPVELLPHDANLPEPPWEQVRGRCCRDCEQPVNTAEQRGGMVLMMNMTWFPICRQCTIARRGSYFASIAYRDNTMRRLDWEEEVRTAILHRGLESVLRHGIGSVAAQYKNRRLSDGTFVLQPPTGVDWEELNG